MSEDLCMMTVMHQPICLSCKKFVMFKEDEGAIVGKCGCKRELVMTKKIYKEFENLDNPIAQSIILAKIEWKKLFNEKGLVLEGKDNLDFISMRKMLNMLVFNMFGDHSEVDVQVVIDKLSRFKLIKDM